jgi:DNA-binding NtrC family response regulator
MPFHLLLSVGSDPFLMKTRSLVLLKAGYAVRDAMTVRGAMRVFQQGEFDLVLICHTIPEDERLQLMAALKAVSPSVKIITIRKDGEVSAHLADGSVFSLDGAEVLLATIANVLDSPMQS